ncbi:hypothetical protein [Mucisphaera sp.]|uniref:hypothetical protein n=1 Tax=Mucisphaera sp. TaxID=2913024 RepID=UPI003D0E1B52
MNIIQQGLAASALQSAQQATETARERDKRARDAKGVRQGETDQLDLSTRIQDDAVELDAPPSAVREEETAPSTTPQVLDETAQPDADHPRIEERVEAIDATEPNTTRPAYRHLDLEA